MKVDGNGQAEILTPEELRLLFSEGLQSPRDKALFGICFYTACRISEALALRARDIRGGVVTFRKATTKGKLRTRAVDVHPGLAKILAAYKPLHLNSAKYYTLNAPPAMLFPGVLGLTEHLTRDAADKILREACNKVGLQGVSTHSFRRTALTQMNNAGVSLRTIQEISGHSSLTELQRYLEVSPEQRRAASEVLSF